MSEVSINPNIESESAVFASKHLPPTIQQVKETLLNHAINAANKVTDTMEYKGDPQVGRLQFDAAKAVLKYNGLETENVSHTVKIVPTELEMDV